MNKHSPEPWYIVTQPGGDVFICANGPEGRREIATIHRWAEHGGSLPMLENAQRIIECVNAAAKPKRKRAAK